MPLGFRGKADGLFTRGKLLSGVPVLIYNNLGERSLWWLILHHRDQSYHSDNLVFHAGTASERALPNLCAYSAGEHSWRIPRNYLFAEYCWPPAQLANVVEFLKPTAFFPAGFWRRQPVVFLYPWMHLTAETPGDFTRTPSVPPGSCSYTLCGSVARSASGLAPHCGV